MEDHLATSELFVPMKAHLVVGDALLTYHPEESRTLWNVDMKPNINRPQTEGLKPSGMAYGVPLDFFVNQLMHTFHFETVATSSFLNLDHLIECISASHKRRR